MALNMSPGNPSHASWNVVGSGGECAYASDQLQKKITRAASRVVASEAWWEFEKRIACSARSDRKPGATRSRMNRAMHQQKFPLLVIPDTSDGGDLRPGIVGGCAQAGFD